VQLIVSSFDSQFRTLNWYPAPWLSLPVPHISYHSGSWLFPLFPPFTSQCHLVVLAPLCLCLFARIFSCSFRFHFVLITNLNANFGLMKMDVTPANKRMGNVSCLIFPLSTAHCCPKELIRSLFQGPCINCLKSLGQWYFG